MHCTPLPFFSHTTQCWSSSQSWKVVNSFEQGPVLFILRPPLTGWHPPHPLVPTGVRGLSSWNVLSRMRLRAAGSLHFARWLNSSFPAVKPSTLCNHHSSTFSAASEKAGTFGIHLHLKLSMYMRRYTFREAAFRFFLATVLPLYFTLTHLRGLPAFLKLGEISTLISSWFVLA